MAERRAGAHDEKLAQVTVAHIGDAPEPRLAAVERWRGVRPRKAANSRPLAKTLNVLDRGHDREAVTGPTPGMVINRWQSRRP
jgi:hypothetical protein